MFELKKLSLDAVEAARERAWHLRLLNHPFLAESICRDILAVKPDDQETLGQLCLTLCDQFGVTGGATANMAMEVAKRLEDEYKRRYYAGMVCERMGVSRLRRGGPNAGVVAYGWLRKAMTHFDSAAEVRPEANDDAILRWNTCARLINARSDVHEGHTYPTHPMLE